MVGKVLRRVSGDIAPEGFYEFLNRFFCILPEAVEYDSFMRLDQLLQVGDFSFQRRSTALQNDASICGVMPDKTPPYRRGLFINLDARNFAIIGHYLESCRNPIARGFVSNRCQ